MSLSKKAVQVTLTFLTGFTLAYILCLSKPDFSMVTRKLSKQFWFQGNSILFTESDLDRAINPDFINTDVLVFLHIQKTGGSHFEDELTTHLEGDPCNCKMYYWKKCYCFVPKKRHRMWLFTRYTEHDVCGVHPDWTGLHECVPKAISRMEVRSRKRRFLYFTWLRDPVKRYLSEWKHVQRGATWTGTKFKCDGREATREEVPLCFSGRGKCLSLSGDDWKNVTLEEFLACPSNLAINRQTRMLANMSLVGCYNRSAMPEEERNRIMLQSAKENLKNIHYFGLTEYQEESQYIFERTFNLEFKKNFKQKKDTHASNTDIPEELMADVREQVSLDIELYQFAKELFFQRLDWFHQREKRVGCQWKRTFPPK